MDYANAPFLCSTALLLQTEIGQADNFFLRRWRRKHFSSEMLPSGDHFVGGKHFRHWHCKHLQQWPVKRVY